MELPFIIWILQDIFKQQNIGLLNINAHDVKNSPSIIGNATRLPFRNEIWDIITSFDLIEHLINSDDFLAEVFRVLKRGVVCDLNTKFS